MKAVPILVVTNALALGLAILLLVQQDDLKTQVQSARSPGQRAAPSGDTTEMQHRIETLERQLRDLARGRSLPAESSPPARVDAPAAGDAAAAMPASEPDPSPEGADAPGVGMPPAEMETFRRSVRKAIELNGQEDRVRVVEDSLDELVAQNRIAPLSPRQKAHIATAILGYREKMPQIWQRMRSMPDGTSREERAQVIREELDTLRAEAQKDLENVVPAVDAKVILEAQVGQGPGTFGGRRGGGGPGFGGPGFGGGR